MSLLLSPSLEAVRRKQAADEARTWIGTPYHHRGRIKGVGVDCAMLLAEVFEAVGAVDRVEPGEYPTDWHLHRSEEVFEGWLERVGAARVEAPQVGDVGLWRFGRTMSHGGIVVSQGLEIVHAWQRGRKVIVTASEEWPMLGRPVSWWSIFGGAR